MFFNSYIKNKQNLKAVPGENDIENTLEKSYAANKAETLESRTTLREKPVPFQK